LKPLSKQTSETEHPGTFSREHAYSTLSSLVNRVSVFPVILLKYRQKAFGVKPATVATSSSEKPVR
jgi:hypothetical protein